MKLVSKSDIRALWVKACGYDRISPDSKFVTFSDHNPHVAAYQTAMHQFLHQFRTVQPETESEFLRRTR